MITINAGIAAIMSVLPSAVVGFCFWLMEKHIQNHDAKEQEERKKRQTELDEREELRKQHEVMLIEGINAAVELSEATARAVQQIPDAHCNGNMHEALAVAETYKAKQKIFYEQQTVANMYAS